MNILKFSLIFAMLSVFSYENQALTQHDEKQSPMKYADILTARFNALHAENMRLEKTIYSTTPQEWPIGNGTLIIGCNRTCEDVTRPTEFLGRAISQENDNSTARASRDITVSGDHSHEDCVTLDILPAPAGSAHIVFDITRPLVSIAMYPLAFSTVYLEKLHPQALHNSRRTLDAQQESVLNSTTFRNCFGFLQPGGKVIFDTNFGIAVANMIVPTLAFLVVENGRIAVIGPNPLLIQTAILRGSRGETLSGESADIYEKYFEFVSETIFNIMKEELESWGFGSIRKCFVGGHRGPNPFNGRTRHTFLIEAQKPIPVSITEDLR